ncbi:unnamed protein product [Fusarium graminearum]|uniref:Chromosome 2, complete genome n=1 Tax=Gibberella zeae (strain ATCC MYA-4620 / CBS 123657 / FGSC 9075 / NRRL 31084 / PH-1) TaxID=229533 RepID=A0A098DCD8_GIBZE|nr:unnamed protein product [Fusarium graminearum]CZS79886.1 unnamed protein product [Fusarium graminearum]
MWLWLPEGFRILVSLINELKDHHNNALSKKLANTRIQPREQCVFGHDSRDGLGSTVTLLTARNPPGI